MHLPVINTIEDVAARQLCAGCGACAGLDPERIEMIDDVAHGRRPIMRDGWPADPERDRPLLDACPGAGLEHDEADPAGTVAALRAGWGPVLEVWEGHAADEAVRFGGSSGGAASAIAIDCIERLGFHGVLHIRARADAPLLNETVLSTTREEIVAANGSRYAPASPGDGIPLLEAAPGPCVFIGKPCDVAAVRRAARARPRLRERLGLTIAIFCAGTPTTRATHRLLERVGVDDPTDVVGIRYRGRGWPGPTRIDVRTPAGIESRTLSYEEAWGDVLTNDKQWRCHVCPDHTGEFADIAVGDPWHHPPAGIDPGRSLVVSRSERGRRLLALVRAGGSLVIEPRRPATLPEAQPNLLRGRGAVWGRLLACRLLGLPVPRYRGLPLFGAWWRGLTATEKLRSLLGTVRRVRRRGLHRRITLRPHDAPVPSVLSRPEMEEAPVRRAA
jgi:coenzyme F420 hydrogenase subunit beta